MPKPLPKIRPPCPPGDERNAYSRYHFATKFQAVSGAENCSTKYYPGEQLPVPDRPWMAGDKPTPDRPHVDLFVLGHKHKPWTDEYGTKVDFPSSHLIDLKNQYTILDPEYTSHLPSEFRTRRGYEVRINKKHDGKLWAVDVAVDAE